MCCLKPDPLTSWKQPHESQNQKYVCRSCPVLPVVNGQCPVSTVFSCDTGTQDRRNRAGLREGKQVRTAPTAIGRSCTFSMLRVGEGVYCPFTHNAKRPRPPSEQQSLFSWVLCYCQIKRLSISFIPRWLMDKRPEHRYLHSWVSILILEKVLNSFWLCDFEWMFCSLLSMTGQKR